MSPEEREEALEVTLEALAHGRGDLVTDEQRAALEAEGRLEAVEWTKADSLDLSLLFEEAAPEVDVSALVASALEAAPRHVPADVAPSGRGLLTAGLVALVATGALGVLRLGPLPSVTELLALGRGVGALFAGASHWVGLNVPFGWAGLGAASAGLSLLLAWPLIRLGGSRRSHGARHALGAAALLLALGVAGPAGPARALDFEGVWPEDEAGVSVDLEGVPASVALRAAAESAGLGLVARLPQDPEVTVHVRDASLKAVVAAILGDVELSVRRQDGLLVVVPVPESVAQALPVPAAPAAPAVPEVPEVPSRPRDLGERVSFGSDVHVAAREVVRRVTTFGGDAHIEGEVLRDVATMGGDVEVAPTGKVRGDVISMGGDIEIAPGGVVEGSVVPMGGEVEVPHDSGVNRLSIRERPFVSERGWFANALSSAADFGLLFLLGLLLMGVARERLKGVQRAIVSEPVRSAVIGLLSSVATLFALVALVITIIGIPAALVVAIVAPAAIYVGAAATASVLGAALPIASLKGRPVLGLAAGVGLLYLTSLVPLVGSLALLAVAAVGFGAVVTTRFGTREV